MKCPSTRTTRRIFAALTVILLPIVIVEHIALGVRARSECDRDDCQRLLDLLTECKQHVDAGNKPEVIKCFCSQKMLNAYVYCKGESRECLQGYQMDGHYDDDIETWHNECQQYLTFTPTTPVLTSLAYTRDSDKCMSAYDACLQRDAGVKSCDHLYSSRKNITEAVVCLCRPSQIAMALRCYLDRTNCGATWTTVNISTVDEFERCRPTEWLTYGQTTAIGDNKTVTSFYSPSPSTRPTPPTITFGPAITPTQTQSAANQVCVVVLWALMAPSLFVGGHFM